MAFSFSEHIQTITSACETLQSYYVSLGIENANLRRQLAFSADKQLMQQKGVQSTSWRGAKPMPLSRSAEMLRCVDEGVYESEEPQAGSQNIGGYASIYGSEAQSSCPQQIAGYVNKYVGPLKSGSGYVSSTESKSDTQLSIRNMASAEERWVVLVQKVLRFGGMTFWAHSCWVSGPESDSNLAMISAVTVAKEKDEEDPNDAIMLAYKTGVRSGWFRHRPALLRGMSDMFMSTIGKVRSETSGQTERSSRMSYTQDSMEGTWFDSESSTQGRRKDICGPPLHPAGYVRIAWNLMSILWICFDAVMMSLDVFDLPDALVWKTLEWLARAFWTADILMSFRTGFYNNFKYETRSWEIAKNYLKTWFVIDMIALIPDYVSIAVAGEYSDIVRPAKLIRLLRLVRAMKMRYFFHAVLETLNSLQIVLLSDMLAYSLMVILWVHICGCLWYAIGKSNDRSWLTLNDYVQMELPHSYFVSVQWAVSQLQGNIDIETADVASEAGFHVGMTLLSIVVLAIFISKLTNMMIQLEQASRTKARQLRALQDYLSMHKVSTDVSMKVKRYTEQKLAIESKQIYQEQELITFLPRALRRSLLQEVRGPRLCLNNPFFLACKHNMPKLFQRICCDLVSPSFSDPDSLVFTYAEPCFEVLFLMGGEVTYDHYNNSVFGAFLKPDQPSVAERSFSQSPSEFGGELRRSGGDSGDCSKGISHLPPAAHHLGMMKRTKTTFNFQHTMSKMMFRERLANKGMILQEEKVDDTRCLCEATLWTRWTHKGDLAAQSHASFLCVDVERFQQMVDFDNDLKRFGVAHAFRFCRILNLPDVKLSDLLTSEDILITDLAEKRKEWNAKVESTVSGGRMDSV